jgi:hypothetical protein
LEADIPQRAVIELVKAHNSGATDEIVREPIQPGAEKLQDSHFRSPSVAPGNATPSAQSLLERAGR